LSYVVKPGPNSNDKDKSQVSTSTKEQSVNRDDLISKYSLCK